MFRSKRRQYLTPMDRIQKKFLRFKIISLAIIALLAGGLTAVIYTNYDYLLFKNLIAHHYIHTDTLDELFAAHGIQPESYARNFDNLVIAIVTQQIRQVDGDVYTFQYTPAARIRQIEGVRTRAETAEFFEIAPGVGYLFLPNISSYVREFVMDNREEINQFDDLILDLRGNNGGVLDDFQIIAEQFLPRGATVGYETARWHLFGWNVFGNQRISRGDQFFEFGSIIILQNQRTASAAEGLIMALHENLDNVTVVGELTYGKGIGQATLPLRGGYAVRATVILIETPSGATVHNIGITPDIEHDSYGDDIVEFALQLIENEGQQ
ncbi:MAG: S41 family peptidase [Defluviitaleaceae bacterium]|nr:S41 family peptidase [Defluviitaleaceae bacterium]